jgi:hypothetical protein
MLAAALCAGCGADEPIAGDPGPPDSLPFEYVRPERGEPVEADELARVTDRYLELLDETRYFESVDERVHGWPESASGGYWYGSWWSGVQIVRENGEVTFLHGADGADNNGLRSAPLLEGACYAQLLWRDEASARVARKIVRGFVAWMLAMQRTASDAEWTREKPLLTRAFYPPPVAGEEQGRRYLVDTSLNRPGLDNGATEYVHLPDNPTYGDIWVKNKRSKDDIGHMLLAIGQLAACDGALGGATDADVAEMRALYAAWARRVEDDGWRIATWDQDGELWLPDDDLARYIQAFQTECDHMLATRLVGRADPGALDCGNGVNGLEEVVIAANDNEPHIFNSFHEAVVVHALLTGHTAIAEAHLPALAARIEETIDRVEAGDPPNFFSDQDFAELVVESATVGVPLTWREVRWVHEQIEEAATAHAAAELAPAYRVFDPATPDGSYVYDPFGPGIEFRNIGTLLGTCVARFRNPASKPLLDCDRVRARAASR